jgi:glutaconate CoA-transferase subunit A
MALVKALVDAGRRNLDVITFAGSLDVEVLVAAGAVRSVAAAYVGLGRYGFAPQFVRAVKEGEIEDLEYSEWLMLHGLRAAAMGVPFLPTRGGLGSELLGHLAVEHIVDPYGGATFLAVPPLRPDVTVIHAWRASEDGNVQFAWPPEHLWDVDVMAARASESVIVTVEEIVDSDDIADQPHLTRLFGLEVDAVVEVPGGAWPTASPPLYQEDPETLKRYVDSKGAMDLSVVSR